MLGEIQLEAAALGRQLDDLEAGRNHFLADAVARNHSNLVGAHRAESVIRHGVALPAAVPASVNPKNTVAATQMPASAGSTPGM